MIVQLTDFEWDILKGCYLPVVKNLEDLTVTVFIEWKQPSTTPEDLVLPASFASPALQVSGITVIVALGVEVQTSAGNVTDSDQTGPGSLKIVDCFTV